MRRSRRSLDPVSITERDTNQKPPDGIHTEIDDELNDLETSDPLLPPDTNTTSALEIVPVHHDVNTQVEGNRDPGNGSRAN